MSFNRRNAWLLCLVGALLVAPAVARAQDHMIQPLGPLDLSAYHNGQPFAGYTPRTYGGRESAQEGVYFSYSALYATISAPSRTAIGFEGTPSNPQLDANGNPIGYRDGLPLVFIGDGFVPVGNDLNTGNFSARRALGHLFELGYMEDGEGWKLGVTHFTKINQRLQAYNVSVVFDDPAVIDIGSPNPFYPGTLIPTPDGIPDLGFLNGFVSANVTYSDVNGNLITAPTTYDRDINLNGVHGRSGLDTNGDGVPDAIFDANGNPIGVDPNDVVRFPVLYDYVKIQQQTQLNSVDLLKTWLAPPGEWGGQFEWGLGARYYSVEDRFSFDGVGGVLNETSFGNRVNNHIIGPEIALKWNRKNARWTVGADARFTAAANIQTMKFQGRYATFIDRSIGNSAFTLARSNVPVVGRATYVTDSLNQSEFTPLLDVRFKAQFQVTKEISVHAGYNVVYMAGLARAVETINYSLPSMGLLPGHNRDDMLIHALMLGFDLNR